MQFSRIVSTVDTHTAGGPTRTITSGIPLLEGNDVAEKMSFFRSHYDHIRKLIMLEPRGHGGMSGAVLTTPSHADAHVGAFFITASGYLPACVHSTIGIVAAGLATGFIAAAEHKNGGQLNVEVPAGLLSVTPTLADGMLQSVAVQTAPAFVSVPELELSLDTVRSLQVSIVFSGVFFVLVDLDRLTNHNSDMRKELNTANARHYIELASVILTAANQNRDIRHPEKSGPQSIDFVLFHEKKEQGIGRDIVINSSGGIDRTPCGAGMGAMVADLHSRGQLAAGDGYVLESFLGTQFTGRVVKTATVDGINAVVPQIEGASYITGLHQFVLQPTDTFPEGLIV